MFNIKLEYFDIYWNTVVEPTYLMQLFMIWVNKSLPSRIIYYYTQHGQQLYTWKRKNSTHFLLTPNVFARLTTLKQSNLSWHDFHYQDFLRIKSAPPKWAQNKQQSILGILHIVRTKKFS